MQETKSGIEISFSMQNMVDPSAAWGLLVPIEIFSEIAKRSGYNGVEYYPFRIPHTQVKAGLLTRKTLDSLTSAHQSFRSEKNLKEVREHRNPKLALQAYLTMPEKFASLKDLKKLQQMGRSNLPLVVYPPREWADEIQPFIFDELKNKLIEPAPELLGGWRIDTTREFADETKARGYGLCLDLFHIRRFVTQGFQKQFERWQDILPVLLPLTREIHLSLGRTDFQGPFDSMQELKDIYTGDRKTDMIPMLEMIRDFGWKGSIVTEIPASSANHLVSSSKIATPGRLIKTHGQITRNLREIMQPATSA